MKESGGKQEQPRANVAVILCLVCGVILLGALMEAVLQAATNDPAMVISTPRKKSVGLDTMVYFPHIEHQQRMECAACHGTIQQKAAHPDNTMVVVHNVCRTCHKKGMSAERVSDCASCHVLPRKQK
ncbi:cytochrome c3 family protein [bacterium]|nr:cytochrome c3 family protein [candidate division CSSED10-310 bacterium]